MIDEEKLIKELEDWKNESPDTEGESIWNNAINQCIREVKRQPKVGEWIPVEEGVPEENEIVDITYETYINKYESGVMTIITGSLTGIAYHKNGKWFDEYDEYILEDVIAWKPRPEPYRKEDKLMKEVKCLLDGHALLEYIGNYYEYVGSENGKFIFQNVNDDSHIKLSYEQLLLNDIYRLIQKGR